MDDILANDGNRGLWINHGDNPNLRGETKFPNTEFRYVTVTYVKLAASGLIVRTAYWKTEDSSGKPWPEGKVDKSVAVFLKNRFPDKIDDVMEGVDKPLPGKGGKAPFYEHLDDFRFSKRSRIYVFLDNDGHLYFDDLWPLIFSPYSAQKRKTPCQESWGKPLDENKSFYNARRKAIPGIPKDQLLYFENHLRDADGKSIPENWPDNGVATNYSINFNIWMKMVWNKGDPVAIVIDPDTGNGSGAPPPANP